MDAGNQVFGYLNMMIDEKVTKDCWPLFKLLIAYVNSKIMFCAVSFMSQRVCRHYEHPPM